MLVEAISEARPQMDNTAAVEPKSKSKGARPSRALRQLPGEKEEKKPDAKFLQDVLGLAQEHFHIRNIGLEFSVHEQTGRIKVTVLDKETGEMIREVPPQ